MQPGSCVLIASSQFTLLPWPRGDFDACFQRNGVPESRAAPNYQHPTSCCPRLPSPVVSPPASNSKANSCKDLHANPQNLAASLPAPNPQSASPKSPKLRHNKWDQT